MAEQKRALITGVTGQDGSMLATYLILKGYKVFGMAPHRNHPNIENLVIQGIHDHKDFELIRGDLIDYPSLADAVRLSNPDEIYNLAAQSFVARSWEMPTYTYAITGTGAILLMEAAWEHNQDIRFYQASTSEMFGDAPAPQNEESPMCPTNPYAVAKYMAHQHAGMMRKARDQYIACGILFNHESEFRTDHFVTQKIAKAAARIFFDKQEKLHLGNLNAVRDWGYAGDYVRAMWLMLQQEEPEDFVIGTGESHTVAEFCKHAFAHIGRSWQPYVVIDPEFNRPNDTAELRADISKAEEVLGWSPMTSFEDLVKLMVEHWVQQGAEGILS